ncbi:MAG: hypothetical protein ACRD2O_00355 [Terriglobia bacterium]
MKEKSEINWDLEAIARNLLEIVQRREKEGVVQLGKLTSQIKSGAEWSNDPYPACQV